MCRDVLVRILLLDPSIYPRGHAVIQDSVMSLEDVKNLVLELTCHIDVILRV